MPGTFFDQNMTGSGEDIPTPSGTPTSSGHVQPTKLFIGGISRRTTTKQLRDHFSKSGRVLDCVAMRTPDGRPRGFGYVTLDSPAAAERFLAEPQMIDDRIVDMKRAVPEAQTPKASSGQALFGASGMMDHSMSMSMQGVYSQSSMYYQWPDQSGFYTDGGFGGLGLTDVGMHQSVMGDPAMDCVDILSHTPHTGTGQMHLDCVDLLTGSLLGGAGFPGMQENFLDHQEHLLQQPLQMPAPSKEHKSEKVPLAEVTNTLGNYSETVSTKKPTFVSTSKLSEKAKPYEPIRIPVVNPLTSLESEPCFIYEDPQADEVTSPAAKSTEPPSPAEADLSPQPPSIVSPGTAEAKAESPSTTEEVNADGLPSLGSAQHATGDCRRCNFFAKGRCHNGVDCPFCHLPHERRKLSRQEKREQQAARQMLQDGATTTTDDAYDSGSEFDDASTTKKSGLLLSPVASRAPPGLSLGAEAQTSEAPVAPALPASNTPSGAALPPGLRPPGLPAPALQAAGQLCQARPAPLGRLAPWEAAGGGLLSTSPCSSAGASSFLLSTTPTSTVARAPGVVPKTAWKETRTVETQTDDDFTCPYCEDCGQNLELVSSRCDCSFTKEERTVTTPPSAKRNRHRNQPDFKDVVA